MEMHGNSGHAKIDGNIAVKLAYESWTKYSQYDHCIRNGFALVSRGSKTKTGVTATLEVNLAVVPVGTRGKYMAHTITINSDRKSRIRRAQQTRAQGGRHGSNFPQKSVYAQTHWQNICTLVSGEHC